MTTDAGYVLARSYGGYTTNLPLPDLRDGQAWVAYEYDRKPLPPEHGGPARLLVPHLYFWKSAKWVTGLDLMRTDSTRVLGGARLPRLRRPVARAAVPGRLISGPRPWLVATIKAATDETATARTLMVEVPGWPGHLPGQHADVRLTAEDGYSRPALVLDRVRPRARPARVHRPAPGRRRGLALPGRHRRAGRPVRPARPDRRLVHLVAGFGPAAAAAGGRLRRRPADVHDPRPRRGQKRGPGRADLLGPLSRRRHLRLRVVRTVPVFAPVLHPPLHPLGPSGRAPRPHQRRPSSPRRRSRRTPAPTSSSAAPPASSRRPRPSWSRPATPPPPSKPSASAPPAPKASVSPRPPGLPGARHDDGPLCTSRCRQRSIIFRPALAVPDNSKKQPAGHVLPPAPTTGRPAPGTRPRRRRRRCR